MTGRSSISIVVINYFNDAEVMSFITTELLMQTETFEIFVLNNGSHDAASLKTFCGSSPRIRYFDSGKNLGYIGGFLYVIGQISDAVSEWIILSNSDIRIESRDMMKSIVSAEYPADVVMLGPSIISSRTRHNQNPFYVERISNRKLKFLSFVFSNYLTYFLYQVMGLLKGINKSTTNRLSAERQTVYAIHGSFMVFRTEFIKNYFDELKDAPYLFGEEIQFAEVALRHRKKTLFVPALCIIHREHSTTRLFKSAGMLRHLKDSIDFRLRKRNDERSKPGARP
jgi:GT2 family glycosyltransferase